MQAEADNLEMSVCVYETVDDLRVKFDGQRATSLKAAPRSLQEVLVMASYLGLPYGREVGVEHLWIADAALCPQLPLGWVQYVDPESKEPFYENVWSSERMWEHPQIAYLRGAVAAIKAAANTARDASPEAAALVEQRAYTEEGRRFSMR